LLLAQVRSSFSHATRRSPVTMLHKLRARKLEFSETIQPDLGCPVGSRKIFRFRCRANHLYDLAPFPLTRGALRDRHERWLGMQWTRVVSLDGRCGRGRRSRVVLMPRRWHQALWEIPRGDGDNKARSPERARRKPLKPLRREGRMEFASTCGD